MSETPKSGMFGLTAMLKWAKNRLKCRYVLPLLVVALLFGITSGITKGQTVQTSIEITNFDGYVVFRLDLYGAGQDFAFGGGLYSVRDFTEAEIAALTRGLQYWTEVTMPHGQPVTPVVVRAGVDPDTSMNAGAYPVNNANGTLPYNILSLGIDPGLEPSGVLGDDIPGYHALMIYNNTWWGFDPNSQIYESIRSLEPVMIHEFGHSMGMAVSTPAWAALLQGNWGERVFTGTEACLVYGDGVIRHVPMTHFSNQEDSHPGFQNALSSHHMYRNYSVYMEAELAMLRDIGYKNIDLRNLFGRSVYTDGNIVVNDNGYYESLGLDGNGDWLGYNTGVANKSTYGLGLHVYGSDNTIIQRGDLLSVGTAAAGIRVDGFNNTIIVDEGTNIHINGDGGTGLLVAFGTGHKIIHRGNIQVNGRGIPEFAPTTGVRFDFGKPIFDDDTGYSYGYVYDVDLNIIRLDGALVDQFDVTGTISGTDAAILIADTAYVDEINFMKGAHIVGDVISDATDYDPTLLTFGKLADSDGSVLLILDPDDGTLSHLSDDSDFTISVLGNIGDSDGGTGRFTLETWGGTTKIDGNVNILSAIVGLGTDRDGEPVKSTLILNGNGTFTETATWTPSDPNDPDSPLVSDNFIPLRVTGQGTLIAGNGTITAETVLIESGGTLGPNNDTRGIFGNLTIDGDLVMEDNSTLQVALGANGVSDKMTVTGTADIGDTSGINFNLLSVFSGTYTLVVTDDIDGLTYAGHDAFLFRGETLSLGTAVGDAKRKTVASFNTEQLDNELVLKIDLTSSLYNPNGTKTRLIWTGAEGTTWNMGQGDNPGFLNWMTHDGVGDVWFLDGDGVIFDLTGTHTINVAETRLVSDMTIGGDGDWTFSGGGILANKNDNRTLDDATGMLVMEGTGTVTFNNDVEFKDGVLIESGTLQIGSGGTSGSLKSGKAIENNALLVFNRSDEVEFTNDIVGTGSLIKRGTGDLLLLGVGTYTGSTTVESGTLLVNRLIGTSDVDVQRGTALMGLYPYTSEVTATGLINNFGTISDFARFQAGYVYNGGLMERIGEMNITGGMISSGTIFNVGAVSVDGDTLSSGLIANVAEFAVDGTMTSTGYISNVERVYANEFVNQGHIITGKDMEVRLSRYPDPMPPATIPRGTFFNDRGILTVGTIDAGKISGTGTLTIDGDFVSTLGTINISVNGSEISQINVINGSATINGGRVNIALDNNPFELNKQYEFIVADKGLMVDTELTANNIDDPLLRLNVNYSNNAYSVSLSRTFLYSGEGETANQRVMGKYIDQIGVEMFAKNPNSDTRNVLTALDSSRLGGLVTFASFSDTGEQGATARDGHDPVNYACDQMGGSVYATMTTASFQNTVMFHASLANVLRRDYNTINSINTFYGRGGSPGGNMWGMFYGNAGSSAHDGNVNGYRQGFTGIMAGLDRINEQYLRTGLFLSLGEGSLSSDLQDKVSSKEVMLGHYHRRDTDRGYTLFQAGLGTHRYDTRRNITFMDRTARNQHNAFIVTAHGEAGLRYRSRILNMSPFVGAQYTGLLREGFTEYGAGSLNLTTRREDFHSIRTMFGMRFDSIPFRVRSGLASFYGNVAWMYEFEADKRHSEFTAAFSDAGVVGPTFTVRGNDPGRDWVQAGFGLNYDFNARVRGFAGYDAYANQQQTMHSANLGFVIQR